MRLDICENCVMPFPGDQLYWPPPLERTKSRVRFCETCFREIFRSEPEAFPECEMCGAPATLRPNPTDRGAALVRICEDCGNIESDLDEAMNLLAIVADVERETRT